MKKFIYIFLIFFSFLGISSVHAVENYTPGQDLGNPDGSKQFRMLQLVLQERTKYRKRLVMLPSKVWVH